MLTLLPDASGAEELFVVDLTAGVDKFLEGVAVVPLVDVHGGCGGTLPEPERGELPGRKVPSHHEPVLRRIRQSAILAAEVVLVGEEEGPEHVRLLSAEQIGRDVLPLILGIRPVLDPN